MDMYEGDRANDVEHEAVSRLFELTREGETACCEYSQLDALVYDGLLRTYGMSAEADAGHAVRIDRAA